MFSRISSAMLVLAVAACGGSAGDNGTAIDCAPAGGEALTERCTVEQSQGSEGSVLTLRHPDGGFRRLTIATDGRGVIAADGAEPAEVTPLGEGLIEVRLGDARYRLPATVKAEP